MGSLFICCYLRGYQYLVPWQELEQERVVEFQPMVVTTFLTPLLWVAVFTVVLL